MSRQRRSNGYGLRNFIQWKCELFTKAEFYRGKGDLDDMFNITHTGGAPFY